MDSRPQKAPAPDVTPMMAQYLAIKEENAGSLLFYRMGDFYELFFDDAVVAARDLGIALTSRGKHLGEPIAMCGVPVHAADQYLQKLIAIGHKVAVCEQTEDPAEAKKRGSKAVVKREVVRLVTPGTLTEDALLDPAANNFLAAVARVRGRGDGDTYGVAWVDISTGEFRVQEGNAERLAALLARIAPSEIVVAEPVFEEPDLAGLWRFHGRAVTPLSAAFFDSATATTRLAEYFRVAVMDAFGEFGRAEIAAAGAALAYVERTQIGARPPLNPPRSETAGGAMLIDGATRTNLELVRTQSGARRGSLLAAINRTVTGPGARLLERRLASPLTDVAEITRRHDAVSWMLEDAVRRTDIRDGLRATPDIARALTRLTLDRGGPRDLVAIRGGLTVAAGLIAKLRDAAADSGEIRAVGAALESAPEALRAELENALDEDVPLLKRDGGFVRAGYHAPLDEARQLRDDSRKLIASMQADYAEATEIRTLRIKHNNVLGYFVEVGANHAERMMQEPLNQRFIHRQTLASAVRFTTSDLVELEQKIAGAGERALAMELEIFGALVANVLSEDEGLRGVADALSVLDVAAGLATLAEAETYVRPRVDSSRAFAITGGRHPVVEQALRADAADAFVPNDCGLGATEGDEVGRIWLVTGPNMAGKSTYLRQNALIAILAQAGSYVPAEEAHIGVVDQLFSRVGAADDLARGRSTFMVEMVETAAILNQAGENSLVILDEIGRGTSTFDGLSIAWAAIEHLHEVNRCRTLFATHYHELTSLAERLDRLDNMTVQVREWGDEVVFLHTIVPGSADRSYGIQVARLAGLPGAVIERAGEVLARLEESDRTSPASPMIDDLPLFTARPEAPSPQRSDPLVERLDGVAPDELTPRDALELIYELKRLRDG